MKLNFPKNLAIFFAVLLLISAARAQNNIAASPYAIGETLTYEGKINKAILRGISVASLNFSVSAAPNGSDYVIDSEAVSKGSLLRLFRFKFFEKISSTVDGKSFSVLRTVKRDEQGDRVRDSEALFDYAEKKVIYVETDPNDPSRPPRRIASTIENQTYDLVAGIYTLRRLPLAVGKTFFLNISDSGLVYKVPVKVTAREAQNSILGKTVCFRVEPDVFGAGRMIEQKGRMSIWITDDARRIPVRAQISTDIRGIDFNMEVRLRKLEMKKS